MTSNHINKARCQYKKLTVEIKEIYYNAKNLE